MSNYKFSLFRFLSLLRKEFIQLKRDRMTFTMIIMIPLMQLTLFGYAINTNPKDLPAVVMSAEKNDFTRAFVKGLENTAYFKVLNDSISREKAENLLAQGKIQFIISIPPNFKYRFIRGQNPQLNVETDATDPVASGGAISAIKDLSRSVFNSVLVGNLQNRKQIQPPIELIIHQKYNPESITQYNIVPGLLGVVLTMTSVIIASLGITREKERGTMENLLATPIQPLEVMIGKISPYIIVGYIQSALILLVAKYVFQIPIHGNIVLLLLVIFPFIAANLSVGITFSSLAKTQLQASQMSIFFFLPSLLLSGFMFPFLGMPQWAQYIGNILPLTHFLRIVRGIVLKGNGFSIVWLDLWPILLFMLVMMLIGLKRYRRTLD